MTQWQPPRHSMSMYASKDDMLASVMKENEELHTKLAEEAARTAEQKLRADQISKQHDMKCAMHKEAVERAMRAESELEAVGAGGVQPLRKDMVPLSDVLERLAQGFGRESAPVTTIRSHFAKNAAQAKQGGK